MAFYKNGTRLSWLYNFVEHLITTELDWSGSRDFVKSSTFSLIVFV